MQPPLTPDQRHGAAFLYSRPVAMLADVPGLGKTAQCVRACDLLHIKSAYVFVPNVSLAINWQREFDKWSLIGHRVTVLRSGKDEIPADGVVICTYALAVRPNVAARLRHRHSKKNVDVIICDEAHALKEVDSERTKLILLKKHLAGRTDRVWLATGTPAPNDAGELYVFAKISGAWEGSKGDFENQFCILDDNGFGVRVVGSKNHEQLRALLAPYYLRRDKIEGRPPLTVDEMPIAAARGLDPYAALSPELQRSILSAIAADDWSLRDVPAIASARRAVGLAKADGVAEQIVTELDGGRHKILCFAYHTPVIDRLKQLIGPRAVIVDGRNSNKRRELVDAFQNDGKPGVLIGQTTALGEGEQITAADRVILAEPSWTPKDNDQPIARAWRRGQTKPVRASFATLAGSLDDKITAQLVRKQRDIEKLI